jgi:WD40 repeat protein
LVIRKATSVDPKDRYATVAEMARELRRAVEGKLSGRTSRRRQLVTFWATLATMAAAIAFFLLAIFGSWRGQDDGGDQPHEFTLHVSPPEAQVTIDSQPQAIDRQGIAQFQHVARGSIDLVVTKEPEYQEVRQSIPLDEFRNRTIEVHLKHRPDYLVKRGADRWQQGNQAGALDDYVAAIEQDAAFSSFPAPIYLLAKGPNRMDRMLTSPDGRWLVCGDATGRVLAWDLQSAAYQAHAVQQHSDAIESIAVGRQWMASADLAGHVMVHRLEGGSKSPQTLDLAENLIKLVITPDDRWLLTGSDDGSGQYVLTRWDVQASDPASTAVKLGVHGGMIDEILLPVGRPTVITASWDRTVREWPLEPQGADAQGRLLGQLTGDVYCLAQVASNIVFAGDGGDASRTEPEDTKGQFRRHRIVLAPLDGQGTQEFPEGHEEQIEVLKASPSGSWLAAGSVDGMIQVWEMVDRKPRGPTVLAGGHVSKVNALSFDATGQWLVSGGDDGVVALWDLQDPATPAIVGRHDGPVTQIVILPDSTAALSCGDDGSVRKWDLPKCQLILRACRRLQVTPKPSAESDTQVET